MLEVYMQNVWVFLGACSGLVIGLTKEGVDLFLSLKSVQGWKQIYTGTAAIRSKKVDNGSSTPFTSQGPIQTEQAVKQFLGTRLPELKVAQPTPRSYSNFPILGGRDAGPVPSQAPVSSTPSPDRQPGPVPHTSAPLPFGPPGADTTHPVLGDPLPDIFGSTSLMGHAQPTPVFVSASIPAAHPAVDSAPSPAVVASPVKGAVVSSSPSSQLEEPYISADGASTTDEGEGSSPEVTTRTDSKMKKLKKRISSKLRIAKA